MFSEFPRESLDYNTALNKSLHILKYMHRLKKFPTQGTHRDASFSSVLWKEEHACQSMLQRIITQFILSYINLSKKNVLQLALFI